MKEVLEETTAEKQQKEESEVEDNKDFERYDKSEKKPRHVDMETTVKGSNSLYLVQLLR